MATKDRRYVMLALNEEFIIDMLTGRIRLAGLPDGATIERIGYDFPRQCLTLLVAHSSYDEVPVNCEPMIVSAQIEVLDEDLKHSAFRAIKVRQR